MGGPEPLVSHLKLFSLEKAAFETLDSLDSPDPSRGEGASVGRVSQGQEHRAPVDLKQQEDVLQQQLLKLKEVRDSGDAAEGDQRAAHERSLLSPPQSSPKAGASPNLRRMSRDSSASQSPTSPGLKGTRPTLRGAGAKAGKVPTTPLNSPMAADEKAAPAIFVSPARAKATPTGSGRVPTLRSNSGGLAALAASAPAEPIFRDKGLASALSNVPSRQKLGVASEEIIPLAFEPPHSEPPAPLESLKATEGGGMPSEIMANWNSEADQEWWTRLHQQLETMHRDVQDYAQRSCPSRRFVRVSPGQLGGYGYGMLVEPRSEGMRLPVAGSGSSMLAPTVGTGDALCSTSLGHTRSGPLPRPPISRNSGPQNSWQPPTPQTPQFQQGMARQMPQQELQRQRVDSGMTGSKVSVTETEDSHPSREVSRPTPPPAPGRVMSPVAGSWLRSPVVFQAAPGAAPVPSERFVPLAPGTVPPGTAPQTPPATTRRPAGVVGQMPVMRTASVGRGSLGGALVSGGTPHGYPSPMTPRGNQVGHVVRQSSCPGSVPRAPSAPPTVLRCQMTPRSLDTKLNVARVGTMPGSMPLQVQYAAMPSGGQISWVKR